MDGILLELFSFTRVGLCLLAGAGGFILTFLIRAIQGRTAGESAAQGGETFLTTFLGSLLAQLTVAVFLHLGDETPGAVYATGLYFLIWPGLIDLVAAIVRPGDPLIGAHGLLWFAFAVGAGAGFFDGFRRTHNWTGLGVVTFLADMTWGLPLTVHALALHLINTIFSTAADEPRRGATRYLGGFRIKGTFAFTQGSVLSNLKVLPGDSLYEHEQVHVFQNRLFGPLFWMTYFGWLILFGFIGSIVWLIRRNAVNAWGTPYASAIPMWWGYFNNPWELWAYTKNPDGRLWNLPNQQPVMALDWPLPFKVIAVAVGMALLGGLWLLVFINTWVL
jgi:hypothetical protein